MFVRVWLLALAFATVTVVMAAVSCAPAPQATPTAAPGGEEPKYGGTLRSFFAGTYYAAGRAVDPTGWDPHKAAAAGTHLALNMTQSKLFQFPQGLQVNPDDYTPMGDLVKSWEYTTPTRLVMRLHEEVRFHNKPPVNGRELTSEDVKFTFERLKKVATFTAYLY